MSHAGEKLGKMVDARIAKYEEETGWHILGMQNTVVGTCLVWLLAERVQPNWASMLHSKPHD